MPRIRREFTHLAPATVDRIAPFFSPRSTTFAFEEVLFDVDPGVFDPVAHVSGIVFARWLLGQDFTDQRVVDVGTGCGLLAHAISRTAAVVVATDVDAKAAACASRNLEESAVEVRCGDLFSAVSNERFDLMVTNPPYEIGVARRPTLRSPDMLWRLAEGWRDVADSLLLAFPTDSIDMLVDAGLHLDLEERIPTEGRELGIFRGSRRPS